MSERLGRLASSLELVNAEASSPKASTRSEDTGAKEVALDNGQLVTAGAYGWTMVATGCGRTIQSARRDAYRLIERVHIPNMRYRRDIGERLIAADYAKVNSLGLLAGEIEVSHRPPLPRAAVLHSTRI